MSLLAETNRRPVIQAAARVNINYKLAFGRVNRTESHLVSDVSVVLVRNVVKLYLIALFVESIWSCAQVYRNWISMRIKRHRRVYRFAILVVREQGNTCDTA
jgi:uncharacterized membrane protein SpoIIM required for sporulation